MKEKVIMMGKKSCNKKGNCNGGENKLKWWQKVLKMRVNKVTIMREKRKKQW